MMRNSDIVPLTPANTLVVEDQTMIRDLLVWACQSTYPETKVEQAKDGASAVKACSDVHPDLIILDLELPDCDGMDLLPKLRDFVPKAKVIVLSTHTDDVTVDRVIHARVEGFVDKNSQPLDALREAVKLVMMGRRFLSPVVQEVWQQLRDAPAAFNKILSEREQQVLGLVGLGLTNSEVAERLGLKVVTAQNHRCNIMSKLDIHSTSHLIRYAREKGFTRLQSLSHQEP